MKNHKGIKIAIGISSIIIIAILYMVMIIGGRGDAEIVYFVSKTSSENSTFWHSVERGVKVATDELGIDLMFVGPERESDLEQQVQLVQEGIDLHPMAIILAASDYTVLSEVAEAVVDRKIPFLTVDSDVAMNHPHSFIATNNIRASEILAEEMAELLGGKGLVGIISHLEGTTSSIDREGGFRQGMAAYENIRLIEEIPYSNNDADLAYDKTLEMVKEYPDIKGIFGTNEATVIGIAKALDDLGLKGQVLVVGFDISDEAASYIEKDIIQSIIIQRPFNMGYLSVMEAYKQAKSGKEAEFIDVATVLVTKDNMFDEENQKFLIPFLE